MDVLNLRPLGELAEVCAVAEVDAERGICWLAVLGVDVETHVKSNDVVHLADVEDVSAGGEDGLGERGGLHGCFPSVVGRPCAVPVD